jgi:hypothetical protein
MKKSDGGLRPIFRQQFRTWQWTSVETAFSASGVPDSEFCTTTGIAGWIEFKQTRIFYVQIKPFQIAWLMRRARMGGNAWIAVRRTPIALKYDGADELWLMKGDQAEALHHYGLEGTSAWMWEGGPSRWNFDEIATLLCNH